MPAVATAGGLPTRLGKYEIMSPLAAGGMARIYIARTTGIGSFERHVVLKMITPERANDQTAVHMFLDEARLAASLNHQNVAQVFEVGEDAGIHYLAMEYVHGQDLRALLAKAGSQGTRVPLELALTVVAGGAAGLHHAHERRGPDGVPLGIVHRDVSPSNIMIGYDGSVKLLDFGIAKATSRSVETQSGIIKGKFAYMAPEQCRGRDVDRRSDVFSLGIILYEISTQHRCFRADSDFDTMHRIVTGDVVRPTRLIQGYPQALEAIVMKALAVDPNQRYQSSGLLLEAIESFAVSARMSLSTMSLGRFMREMFGEQPEPWLNQNRGSSPHSLQPKQEGTISNTNNTGAKQAPVHRPTPAPQRPEQQNMQAATTLLDLPRPRGEEREPEPDHAEWNAKSYPTVPPAGVGGGGMLPPEGMLARASQPHLPQGSPINPHALPLPPPGMPVSAVGSQPMPPHQTGSGHAFAVKPGSGSGPSHSAMRQAYPNSPTASGNDLSYPRYEVPADPADDLRLKPNRRPLFIGLGIIAVGVAVLLAMTIGNSGKDIPNTTAAPTPGSEGSTNRMAVLPGSDTPQEVEEDSINVKITTVPEGASVLYAGHQAGKTPFEKKMPKKAGKALFYLQLPGYKEEKITVDMTGTDFEKTNLILKKLDDKTEGRPPTTLPDPAELEEQKRIQEAERAAKEAELAKQAQDAEAKRVKEADDKWLADEAAAEQKRLAKEADKLKAEQKKAQREADQKAGAEAKRQREAEQKQRDAELRKQREADDAKRREEMRKQRDADDARKREEARKLREAEEARKRDEAKKTPQPKPPPCQPRNAVDPFDKRPICSS